MSDKDPRIGQDAMPYPLAVGGPSLVNYQSVATHKQALDADQFSSQPRPHKPSSGSE